MFFISHVLSLPVGGITRRVLSCLEACEGFVRRCERFFTIVNANAHLCVRGETLPLSGASDSDMAGAGAGAGAGVLCVDEDAAYFSCFSSFRQWSCLKRKAMKCHAGETNPRQGRTLLAHV